MKTVRMSLWCALLLAASVVPASGEGAGSAPGRPDLGPEVTTVTLNAYDDEINGLIDEAEEEAAAGRFLQASRLFQDAADRATDQVRRVGRREYLGIREYMKFRVRTWPEEGLAAYRRVVDARAADLYQRGRAHGDVRLLRTVVRRFGLSSSGPAAALDLGTRALLRGDLDRALFYLLGILHEYPTGEIPGVSRGEVLVRAGLASAKRSDRLLLAELASRAGPEDRATVGGEPTSVRKFLEGLEASAPGTYAPEGWTTVGGCPSRTGGAPGPRGSLVPYWSWKIPQSQTPEDLPGGGGHSPIIPVHPLIVDGLVVVVGHGFVFGIPLPEPGQRTLPEPKWRFQDPKREEIVNSRRSQPPAHATAEGGMLVLPFRDCDDEYIDYTHPEDVEKKTVIALGLEKEGYLLDQRGAADPAYGKRYRDVRFAGSPVVVDGRVYVTGNRFGRLVETVVFCFDKRGETIRLHPVWETSVCLGTDSAPSELIDDLMYASSVSLKNGILYVCSNTGAVGALDAESGDILWIHAYEQSDPGMGLFTREPVTRRSWFRNPPMLDDRRLYVAPMDSEKLYIYFHRPDLATSHVAHAAFGRDDLMNGFDPEYVLGARDGIVFLAGSSRVREERPLFAVKAAPTPDAVADQNRILWRAPIEEDSPYGRGVLAGDHIFFPTEKAIYRVAVADGSSTRIVVASDPAVKAISKHGRVVGNLAVSGPWLVSASETAITLFGPAPEEKK